MTLVPTAAADTFRAAEFKASRMTELQLLAEVLDLVYSDLPDPRGARPALEAYHHPDSRRATCRGFPDLVIVGPGGVLWRELKNQSDGPTPDQTDWGRRLTANGHDWAIWKPMDLLTDRIAIQLSALRMRYAPVGQEGLRPE
jgi:hypothetical protein